MPSRWKYITAAWLRNCTALFVEHQGCVRHAVQAVRQEAPQVAHAGQGAAQFADAMLERGAVAERLRALRSALAGTRAADGAARSPCSAARPPAAPAPHRIAERDAQQRRAGGPDWPATTAAAMPPARRPAARGTPAGRAWAKAATRPGKPAAPAARRTARSTRAAAPGRRYRRAPPAAHGHDFNARHAARVMGHRRRIGVAQAGGPGADQHMPRSAFAGRSPRSTDR